MKTRTLVGLLALSGLLATPLGAALPVGVDAGGVAEMKSAGATPAYGQVWVGEWTKSNWGAFESDLRKVRDQGATPVVMWYYWGDGISVNGVKYGKDGKSRGEWDYMAGELAKRANAVMGGRAFLVVLEPEFNKNGIQHWDTFDGYLASQAWKIRGAAPNAKIVTGFGHWGGWDIFDKAMGASHYSGFQLLRGSTRDSSYQGEHVADDMLRITKSLKAKFGKGVFMYDLAVATYGGWEGVQERAIQRVAAKAGELEAAGLKGMVWRYVKDNSHSSGYYGAAESSWGVKFSWGGKKRAYDDLVSLVKSGGSSSTTSTSSSSSSSSSSIPSNPFSGVSGGEWWIQAKAAGSPTSVSARVDGGSSVSMSKQWWGAYAVSTKAPTGSVVSLTAKYADGTTRTVSYRWPDATITSATSGSTSTSGTFDATFSGLTGNDWWIQTKASGSQGIAKVDARVNGGSWVPLQKQSWGAWATSTRAPSGTIELRATSTSGATDVDTFAWRR